MVPRSAVLMAGNHSVVYVETKPGRFEIRQVVLGPSCGDQIVILSGLEKGEHVATRGNFLIDSQMQLAGNPSLIDPSKAEPKMNEEMSEEVIAALSKLSDGDREMAKRQRICPVAMELLGSMGTPKKVDVDGRPIFICCEGCRSGLLKEPEKYLAKLADAEAQKGDSESESQPDLPPIGTPKIVEPQGDLPPIEAPQEILESPKGIEQAPDKSAKRTAEQGAEVVR